MTARTIDLNCDLGENPDRVRDGTDAALLDIVTSANIACGGHAGDPFTMSHTVRAAMARGVAIGAHPSYPDPERFGRVEMVMPLPDLKESLVRQIAALQQIVTSLGATLRHVKPHGALYHAAMTRMDVAATVADAVRQVDPSLVLVGLSGAPGLARWNGLGFRVFAEAFADRRYEPDGSLRSRSLPGSLISDPVQAAAQATHIALHRPIETSGGWPLVVSADTICVHSDTPDAVNIARGVRTGLTSAGLNVVFPAVQT